MDLEKLKEKLKPEKQDLTIIKQLQETLDKQKIKAKVMLGGSLAQKTNLKGDSDIDLFVKFKEDKNTSDKLEKAIKQLKYPYERIKGSRDYFQIQKQTTIEAVPVLEIENHKQAKTIVDVSPLHVAYFNKHANDHLRGEVRLVKQFCKANNVYGAESHIKGLSGHTINLLMLKYKTFNNFITQVTKWKPKVVIDLEKHHKHPELVLNQSKIESPLIIVDPVQPNRNAAAALSQEKFDELIQTAKKYKKNPSEKFFEKQPIPKAHITIKLELKEGKKDIQGSKIVKIKEYIDENLKKEEFKPNSKLYFNDKTATITINPLPKKHEPERIIQGPFMEMMQHTTKFKEKYKKTYVKNNRLNAKIKRKYLKPEELVEELLKKKYVKEKAKKILME